MNNELAGIKLSVIYNLFNRNVAVVLGILSKQRPRSIWCIPRSKNWWQLVHLEIIGGEGTYAYPKVRSTLFALNYVPLFQEEIPY